MAFAIYSKISCLAQRSFGVDAALFMSSSGKVFLVGNYLPDLFNIFLIGEFIMKKSLLLAVVAGGLEIGDVS